MHSILFLNHLHAVGSRSIKYTYYIVCMFYFLFKILRLDVITNTFPDVQEFYYTYVYTLWEAFYWNYTGSNLSTDM